MEGLKRGLSGNALKWIAIVTMLIDHIGAVILIRLLLNYQYSPELSVYDEGYSVLYYIMTATRTIGRLAFPIFCFLLVEGFLRTGSRQRYVIRLFIFALLSEIPFDLAFAGKLVHWGYQNVMVTLLIGMLTMWGCSVAEKQFKEKKWILLTVCLLCSGLGMLVAHLLHTDYGAKGIIAIMLLYFFRYHKLHQALGGAIGFIWEAEAMISFLFIYLYNGMRGRQMKYFFYLFYPLHLLLLYALSYALGIHWIAVVQ
ncbi:MAG: conjugal transfer protein TraX [Lachnospiraceae bacterium]|nr:conjugal transfer protein TraX [Lachnospiraceae bacterium]